MIDKLIETKVENPGVDFDKQKQDVIRLVVKMIELDGMDA